jgi:alpha-galactosidase
MKAMLLRKRGISLVFIVLLATAALGGIADLHTTSARASAAIPAESNGLALTPFMGWSTWDYLESPTQAGVEAQAAVEASKLKAYGYTYTMIDTGWYFNPGTTVDQYGRWSVDTGRFPNGLAAVASYVHSLGLKFGAYLTPGIPVAAVNKNTPIQGTSYHAKDIANTGAHEPNYSYGNSVMYAINYSKPGAQAYINSWADQLASWGVDFLKMDGVGTRDIGDIQAWSAALKQSGRPIVFDLSNQLALSGASTWKQYANAWRIGKDDECYCKTQTNWAHVARVFGEPAPWVKYAGPGGWNDLDSLQISNGTFDGLSNNERQTMMGFWAIEAAPLFLGDDLTRLDTYGLSLLTNKEVIAVDQAGRAASPVSQATSQQVWFVKNSNGSYTVGLFNLGSTTASVKVNWSNLGFSGSATVHDLWSHSNLGSFSGSFSATLSSHASRLLTITHA